MENVVESGHQVQILETNGRTFELNVHALSRILLNDRVKDKPVAVVSVVGAFRGGKSFLLNFFIRYLRNWRRTDWLGDTEAPLEGFDWRGGSERHTMGIYVWNEVFLVETSGGQELAVLLMDTQGTFDCQTSAEVDRAIFSLSTMVSSVLVYNVSRNIREDQLQNLQLFTEYGIMMQEEMNREPFQNLLFLVRDWCFSYENSYGIKGGRELLERRLKISENMSDDLRQLRERIRSCFTSIDCFLMPQPGKQVTTERTFDGRLSHIEEEFKQELGNLVPWLLAPDNIPVKNIRGRGITCHELMAYFQVYVHVFKTSQTPAAESVFEATVQASNLAAMHKARDLYMTKMVKVWQEEGLTRETMEGHHYRLREESMELFESTPKMGGEEYAQRYLESLTAEIEEIFSSFSTYVGEKKRFIDSLACKALHGTLIAGLGVATVALAAVALPKIAAACVAVGAVSASAHIFHWINIKRRERKRTEEQNRTAAASSASDTGIESTQLETDESFENSVNQSRDG